ncbi:PREDICTED: anoctamin-9, partial [Tauraco erythrolophus]|uniref:anoctamin-9 n=1 Tax=Tauraco erythrolophus TaxID=121530 RepID=UPI000523DBB1
DEILLTPWRDFPVEDSDPFAPPDEEKWDFVLVSDIHEVGSAKEIKRKKFLDELSKKGFTIKFGMILPGGEQTGREKISTNPLRSAPPPEKLHDLIKKKVFEAAFPLHEKEEVREFLKEKWARWRDIFCQQPIEKISKEICEATDTIMCPLCDQKCPFWRLSDTCTYAKVTHMIDNEGTVLFAMFMAIWATVFLELWKRQRATVVTDWDLFRWDEEEEELAMELINNLQHEPRQYQHSYVRSTIVLLLFLVMIAVLIGIAHALVMTGAVLHYITIVVMTKVNRRVALYLCDLEKPRTFSQRENNFTVKIFTFQFFTNFSSLIYIAFFLGRINGHPGNYVRVAGKWRLEECHPSGCITDLFIQMAIIMLLKQTISNVMEYLIPWIAYKVRKKQQRPKKRSLMLGEEEEAEDPCKRQGLSNYRLNEVNIFSLFDEFLEM